MAVEMDRGRMWADSSSYYSTGKLKLEDTICQSSTETGPSPASEADFECPRSYYLYRGAWYESLQDLAETMECAAASVQVEPTQADVERIVRKLFGQYIDDAGEGLQMHEFKGLAASLAAELHMDPRRFGNFCVIFYRFDVNADGKLDEEECVLLAESMLRHYRHSLHPRTPGGPKLLHLEFKDLEAHYDLGEQMGRGGQGAVFLAYERGTRHERVVKFFDKKNANAPLEEIKSEFMLLRSMDHPKIQRLYDIFEDRTNVYVVSEPYHGGNLHDLLDNALDAGITATSAWIAKVVYQVMQGVAYLHSKYVIHCDLKESNVMIVENNNWTEPSAVVIDFGMARNFAVHGCSGGTAGYIPPEVWRYGLWTPKGDVFALGVIMFQLFTNGDKCFKGWDRAGLMRATCEAAPDLDAITRFWRRCCTDLLPFLDAMLQKDFRLRPTVRECMSNVFFTKRLARDEEDDEGISPEIASALCTLSSTNWTEVQRALSTDIAARLNLAELRDLNGAFAALDTDHDGVITAEEMRASLQNSLEPDEVEMIVRRVVGPDGRVPYTMFMGQLLASEVADAGRLLWREFRQLDTSGRGLLSRSDVAQLLERPVLAKLVGRRGVSSIMALMDIDGDGCVSFEEFRRALGGEERLISEYASSDSQAGFQLDEDLEYDSPSWNEWIPCKVIAVSTNGAIKINLKPDYWMRREEQQLRLRPYQG